VISDLPICRNNIVIILKESPSRRPPKNIELLLKSRTYIKWNPEEESQADFYERLKEALCRQSDSYRYHKVIP
jgi:hypothetical protein